MSPVSSLRLAGSGKGSSILICFDLIGIRLGHYLSLEGIGHRKRTGDPTEGIDDVRWYSGGERGAERNVTLILN